ncbi:HD domain-containing protein [bacterium]|nr:MAG: HD domain-containing protein [bacterium]
MHKILDQELITAATGYYMLPLEGLHGNNHWQRVFENGLRLAASTGADIEIVTLFALMHDLGRQNEGIDSEHGARSAEIARQLRSEHSFLDDTRFQLLHTACANHNLGYTEADITIQTCWDADRLDLGRIGMMPKTQFLCTEAARDPEVIEWAVKRSLG